MIRRIAAAALAVWQGRLREMLGKAGDLMAHAGGMRWQEVREASMAAGSNALRLPYGAVIAAGTVLSLVIRN